MRIEKKLFRNNIELNSCVYVDIKSKTQLHHMTSAAHSFSLRYAGHVCPTGRNVLFTTLIFLPDVTEPR